MVTNELRGERVDVVPFSDDPVDLIQNALAPARVREVRLDEETGTATVVVSDFQLSLAIGKEGQNARLAARLTGWRIDIKSETQLAEEEAGYGDQEWAEGEWVEDESGEMVWKPAEGGEAMSAEEWTHQADVAPGDDPVAAEPVADRRPVSGRRVRHYRGRGIGPGDGSRGIVPTRTCVGCRKARPADVLFRVVRQADGQLRADRTGPGRGAWLCRESPACIEEAARRRAFDRAFRAPVATIAIEHLRASLKARRSRMQPMCEDRGLRVTPGPTQYEGHREPLAEEDPRL